jgi:hypothetical protein
MRDGIQRQKSLEGRPDRHSGEKRAGESEGSLSSRASKAEAPERNWRTNRPSTLAVLVLHLVELLRASPASRTHQGGPSWAHRNGRNNAPQCVRPRKLTKTNNSPTHPKKANGHSIKESPKKGGRGGGTVWGRCVCVCACAKERVLCTGRLGQKPSTHKTHRTRTQHTTHTTRQQRSYEDDIAAAKRGEAL